MKRKYTDEQIEFLRKNSVGKFNSEITKLFNENFGTTLSEQKIASIRYKHGFKNNLTNQYAFKYTDQHISFLIKNAPSISLKELTNRFNEKFALNKTEAAISSLNKKFKLNNGIDKKYKKGRISENKKPIGSERVNIYGYIEIKVSEPNKWKLKHHVIYEKAHGKPPKGFKLVFLDSNKLNCKLENLTIVSDAELLLMNQNSLITSNKNLTASGALIAKLMATTFKKINGGKDDDRATT